MSINLKTYFKEVDKELTKNILPFWINHVQDKKLGGYYGYLTNDLKTNKEADKGCILNSRILWTYSSAYRKYKKKQYLDIAKRTYDYMMKYFWDKKYSGLYWMLNYKGEVVNDRKQIYNVAFGIYALSEYYLATKNKKSLEAAIELFKLIEKYSYEPKDKGYIEAFDRQWTLLKDVRLSDKDMNKKKIMNTNLHVMEAYTNLLRAWDNKKLKSRLKELVNVTMDKIIDTSKGHFKLFFEDDWTSISNVISYGHDIEGSWLLYEAAEVLKDKKLINTTKEIAIDMAQKTYEEGWDKTYGGLYEEGEGLEVIKKQKAWWPQAEAMIGFLNAYQLTGQEHFLKLSIDSWEFVKKCFIDKQYGEWYMEVAENGTPMLECPKVEPWKCPYHNARACIEVMHRIEHISKSTNKKISKKGRKKS